MKKWLLKTLQKSCIKQAKRSLIYRRSKTSHYGLESSQNGMLVDFPVDWPTVKFLTVGVLRSIRRSTDHRTDCAIGQLWAQFLSGPASQNMEYGYIMMASRYSRRGKSLPWIPYTIIMEPNSRTYIQKATKYFISHKRHASTIVFVWIQDLKYNKEEIKEYTILASGHHPKTKYQNT